jgi:predicted dehydrogenase
LEIKLPVVIHGISGRMGQIACKALFSIAQKKMAHVDKDVIIPVPIGVGRNVDKTARIARDLGLVHFFCDLNQAIDLARKINSRMHVYHNTLATAVRKDTLLPALALLDPAVAVIFMEKPIATHYGDGRAIVETLIERGFRNGVVHHMLSTPGLLKAIELLPEIKPVCGQMIFGYEVGSGLSGNKEFSGQRPDFNWRFSDAGGGIILDMCHEGYLSAALFGETERLSAVARLVVPQRKSSDGSVVISCDVEDYAAYRREHSNGMVNTSVWTWCRRINSEFGPLEITIEGENGTLVFGLYGLKVQWKETAPANRWEKSVTGQKIAWRDYWQSFDLPYHDPFAYELVNFFKCMVTGVPYPRDAVRALNILGQVEALYQSAAHDGKVVEKKDFLLYPAAAPPSWQPERLQGKLKVVI